MLSKLQSAKKTVGLKQSKKAVKDGNAKFAFVASDADRHIIKPFLQLCAENKVEVIEVSSMEELGNACGIDVGAAVAVILE